VNLVAVEAQMEEFQLGFAGANDLCFYSFIYFERFCLFLYHFCYRFSCP
jgi:hypothetical protein